VYLCTVYCTVYGLGLWVWFLADRTNGRAYYY